MNCMRIDSLDNRRLMFGPGADDVVVMDEPILEFAELMNRFGSSYSAIIVTTKAKYLLSNYHKTGSVSLVKITIERVQDAINSVPPQGQPGEQQGTGTKQKNVKREHKK